MSGTKIVLKTDLTMTENSGITFEYAYTEFQKFCNLKNLRPKTIHNYEENYLRFKKYLDEYANYSFITELKQYDINNYVLCLKNSGMRDTSINTYLRGVRTILNFWSENYNIQTFKIRIHKADKSIKETYTDEELFRLLARPSLTNCEFTTFRNWCIINFFLGTGVRVSTLIHIKIEDIDLNFDRIQLTYTKNRKSYIIPLSGQLKQVLEEYLSYRKGRPEDYLFCNQYGEQLTTDAVKHAISKYNKSRGVNRCGLHAFRHTFAKKCVMNGVNVFVLQRLLGHSDISVTREYVDLYADDLAKNIDMYNPLDTLNSNKKDSIKKKTVNTRKKISMKK